MSVPSIPAPNSLSSRLSSKHTMRFSQLLFLSPLLLLVAANDGPDGNKYPLGKCPNADDAVIELKPCNPILSKQACPGRPSDANAKVLCKNKGYKLPTRREVNSDLLVFNSLWRNVYWSSNCRLGKQSPLDVLPQVGDEWRTNWRLRQRLAGSYKWPQSRTHSIVVVAMVVPAVKRAGYGRRSCERFGRRQSVGMGRDKLVFTRFFLGS